jgi:hypothetical protein
MQFSFKKNFCHIYTYYTSFYYGNLCFACFFSRQKIVPARHWLMVQAVRIASTEFTQTNWRLLWWTNSMFGGMSAFMIQW